MASTRHTLQFLAGVAFALLGARSVLAVEPDVHCLPTYALALVRGPALQFTHASLAKHPYADAFAKGYAAYSEHEGGDGLNLILRDGSIVLDPEAWQKKHLDSYYTGAKPIFEQGEFEGVPIYQSDKLEWIGSPGPGRNAFVGILEEEGQRFFFKTFDQVYRGGRNQPLHEFSADRVQRIFGFDLVPRTRLAVVRARPGALMDDLVTTKDVRPIIEASVEQSEAEILGELAQQDLLRHQQFSEDLRAGLYRRDLQEIGILDFVIAGKDRNASNLFVRRPSGKDSGKLMMVDSGESFTDELVIYPSGDIGEGSLPEVYDEDLARQLADRMATGKLSAAAIRQTLTGVLHRPMVEATVGRYYVFVEHFKAKLQAQNPGLWAELAAKIR